MEVQLIIVWRSTNLIHCTVQTFIHKFSYSMFTNLVPVFLRFWRCNWQILTNVHKLNCNFSGTSLQTLKFVKIRENTRIWAIFNIWFTLIVLKKEISKIHNLISNLRYKKSTLVLYIHEYTSRMANLLKLTGRDICMPGEKPQVKNSYIYGFLTLLIFAIKTLRTAQCFSMISLNDPHLMMHKHWKDFHGGVKL